MSEKQKETLEGLLREAASKFSVSYDLLREIQLEERLHLYLAHTSKQSVRKRLRELLQEASKNVDT